MHAVAASHAGVGNVGFGHFETPDNGMRLDVPLRSGFGAHGGDNEFISVSSALRPEL